MERKNLRLRFGQRVSRAYGIWWDMINIGTVVFVLAFAFVGFSIIIIAGRTELLPFQETVWRQFIETVPPQKQSEIGLGLLSVSVSAASAAALYLIRIGTVRWANNRRIGHIHGYFAEAIHAKCQQEKCDSRAIQTVVSAFVVSSLNVFEQISETHPKAQKFFEFARMKAHILLQSQEATVAQAKDVALDLFVAALICQKQISIPMKPIELETEIRNRLSPAESSEAPSLHGLCSDEIQGTKSDSEETEQRRKQ